jgi:uncharacterized membrane protein YagU involved in acid resistance
LTLSVYFKLTKKQAPAPAPDAFEPPEPEQRQESPTQTVARRTVELLARRQLVEKQRAGELVHYAFGAGWGGLYGLLAGTFPRARGLASGVAFGVLVWAVSDNLLLPAFRLSPWPQAVPLRVHAYMVGGHVVYGATLAGTYAVVKHGIPPLALLAASHWLTRNWPGFARPTGRRLTRRALDFTAHARSLQQAMAHG